MHENVDFRCLIMIHEISIIQNIKLSIDFKLVYDMAHTMFGNVVRI